MTKAPYLFTGLAGTLIVLCLSLGARIYEMEESNTELSRENSKLQSNSDAAQIRSNSTGRSRSIRKKHSRYIAVNYAFLEQGLQVSLPKLYGDYLLELNLSPSESRYFESLLVERLIAQQQFGLELMTGDHDDRLISTQTLEGRITENNSNIRQFLNHPEDYAEFVRYEKQVPERRSLADIRPLLSKLTRETEEQLIDILYQCRVKTEGELPIWETILADEDVATRQDCWRRSDENLAQILPSLLPDDLARDFLTHWKIVRDNQRKQYDITRSLFHRDG